MLHVHAISKSYGADPVLRDVSVVLNTGERAGLVGPNGSGKSTLLRILAGQIAPDAGHVALSAGERIAYLPQYPFDDLHLTVREALLRGAGAVGEAQIRVTALEADLEDAKSERQDILLAEYAEARETFEGLGGYELEARMHQVIHGLALGAGLDARVLHLSGGNKTKLSLAGLLLSDAGILLLDEPTNYLDLPALLWLERFVRSGSRSYLIVSHDRRFLDRTVDSILELDPVEHSIRVWPGNYSAYAEGRLREQQKRLAAYQDQQAEISRIEEDIRRTREQARGVENRTNNDVQRRYAKKVAKKAKAREQRLEREFSGSDLIEKPQRGWGLHLVDLGRNPIEDHRTIVEVHDLRAGHGPRPVLRGIDFLIRGRDRLALLGENGSGKTTLLRCLTGEIPFTGTVRLGPSVRVGLLSQETAGLPQDQPVLDVLRSRVEMHEDEARTYLHKFLFTGDEALKTVGTLSYGQQAKLALAVLVLSGANFLILDEPTSHLDMPALEAIEQALAAFRGPLLVVSHDRYFLERLGVNRMEVMEDGLLRPVRDMDQYEDLIGPG
jgi:ATP-binding cassette subfamily F protein 3